MDSSKNDEAQRELGGDTIDAALESPAARSADRGAELQRAWLAGRPLPAALADDPPYCVELRLEDLAGGVVRLGAADGNGPAQGNLEEVARFELDGARYALIIRMSVRARRALQAEQAAVIRTDYPRQLSQRERQIVELMCAGATAAKAGERLGIREMTVRSYLKSVFCKLGVRSTQAMVCRYALALARAQSSAQRRPN